MCTVCASARCRAGDHSSDNGRWLEMNSSRYVHWIGVCRTVRPEHNTRLQCTLEMCGMQRVKRTVCEGKRGSGRRVGRPTELLRGRVLPGRRVAAPFACISCCCCCCNSCRYSCSCRPEEVPQSWSIAARGTPRRRFAFGGLPQDRMPHSLYCSCRGG